MQAYYNYYFYLNYSKTVQKCNIAKTPLIFLWNYTSFVCSFNFFSIHFYAIKKIYLLSN